MWRKALQHLKNIKQVYALEDVRKERKLRKPENVRNLKILENARKKIKFIHTIYSFSNIMRILVNNLSSESKLGYILLKFLNVFILRLLLSASDLTCSCNFVIF